MDKVEALVQTKREELFKNGLCHVTGAVRNDCKFYGTGHCVKCTNKFLTYYKSHLEALVEAENVVNSYKG